MSMPGKFDLHRDTIFALSSGGGRAAIAVVRLSGLGVPNVLSALRVEDRLQDRVATLRVLRDPETGEALDRAMVLRFYGPRSFTGEEMAELHVTGSRAVLKGVISALGRIAGTRAAEPGEFVWRAFVNGKLDLSEVEGLGDLVNAETAVQRRQALRTAGGALTRESQSISALILDGMSLLEAQIDFSDVEDVDLLSLAHARSVAWRAQQRIRTILTSSSVAERVRDGLNVIIAGPPNVGKSTLMNVISKREVSIVSATPGTTRDLVEVQLDIRGFPVTLIDSAGIRDASDPIEREGVERARQRAKNVELQLWLTECGDNSTEILNNDTPTIIVETKSDCVPAATNVDQRFDENRRIRISAKTGDGIATLLEEIAIFAERSFEGSEGALISTERQRIAFVDADAALNRLLNPKLEAIELAAEELRAAAHAMERVAGRVNVDDVLESIFSRFCVGK